MIGEQILSNITHRWLIAVAVVTCMACPAQAQFGFGGIARVGVVGGVSVDAEGAVQNASAIERAGWLKEMREAIHEPTGELADKTELRMISLSKLQSEIAHAKANDRPLSDEVLYLAGLQRIEYIFVYPEQNDIVLAGPAEGWVVRHDASVVGKTTGRPVLQLEDLLTALRTTEASRQKAISVSIDPTPEGEVRLNRLLAQVRTSGAGFDPTSLELAMREAFGPQTVKLTTVASDSRMAHTLVAADYRMKRLAMNLEESPVAGLPSYMSMIRDGGSNQKLQPRWWMSCDYDAILHSDDMLAWKLTGRGIKAMSEDELVDNQGTRSGTGRANKFAQRWADLFTEKFDELCAHNAAFGDLRNVMDLNIVATVISGHELEKVAGCDFGLLKGEADQLPTPSWKTPKTITPECSFVKGRVGWTVSASGGVELNPWQVVSQQAKSDSAVKVVYAKAVKPTAAQGDAWWW